MPCNSCSRSGPLPIPTCSSFVGTTSHFSLNSTAFIADAMVVMDFAWTVAGSAGPNAHHLETALAAGVDSQVSVGVGRAAAEESRSQADIKAPMSRAKNTTPDMWAPYRATGLQLKISTEVSSECSPVLDGPRLSRGGPRASPIDRRTTRTRSDIGHSNTTKSESFPRSEETGKQRGGNVGGVGDELLRAPRHERAGSEGPLPPRRRSFGRYRSGKPAAAARGRGSGSLSDILLRRSRAPSDASEEGRKKDFVGDAKGGAEGGGRTDERLSVAPQECGGDRVNREAVGAWASSSDIAGMREGRERGEVERKNVGERGGDGGERPKEMRVRRPLRIHIADGDGPGDALVGNTRTRRVEGEKSNGPASRPSRTSGDGNARGEGRGARSVLFTQVTRPPSAICLRSNLAG